MSEASDQMATLELFELGMRLGAIFTPYAKSQTEKFYDDGKAIKPLARFVHYATSEAATPGHTK